MAWLFLIHIKACLYIVCDNKQEVVKIAPIRLTKRMHANSKSHGCNL
ncbi:hypothetical protein M2459_001225 [Parabacteroides sp. PF5-5]|nr:hypothetical protein [Parabacteroides sp. PH5-39]MDH6315355.1 hypothetical protein [Parabacteroides sp. PF5-13]MDH6319151.1 hypothetical protein [Parabacteroides sp. PH5-13]MDH6322881.1 hypothetical protein [Parabacteroides sp. PH5-8]MDH6326547.1 hypothetical protein [Parabacteroides sp. PH5-41]MDH6334483.1 hypothetical protein [Parabacteroides sp. PF5-5]MDH6345412.1 hypothetical protein [Parabacteroides sp. PH5-46]MDH6360368.1 hypothetical protein [Parabacteroides sp. PH5-16]MDH6376171.